MNTYLTIDEQDEEYIINVEISDSEKIDRNKLNKTIKQISKFIKKNDKKKKRCYNKYKFRFGKRRERKWSNANINFGIKCLQNKREKRKE